MSITNHCGEDNSTPYCSFLDIESSFSPSFFSNMKGVRDAHFDHIPGPENTAVFLPEIKAQLNNIDDFPLFCENFSHETYIFL